MVEILDIIQLESLSPPKLEELALLVYMMRMFFLFD
jgi:hypothetical protein